FPLRFGRQAIPVATENPDVPETSLFVIPAPPFSGAERVAELDSLRPGNPGIGGGRSEDGAPLLLRHAVSTQEEATSDSNLMRRLVVIVPWIVGILSCKPLDLLPRSAHDELAGGPPGEAHAKPVRPERPDRWHAVLDEGMQAFFPWLPPAFLPAML